MTIAAVQRVAKGNQGSSTSITIGSGDGWSAPTSGNLLVVSGNGDFTMTTPTGSGTWTAGPSVVDGNGAYVWYKVATGTETAVTAQVTSGTFQFCATVCEYSGVGAFDVSNSSTISGTGGTVTSAAAVTTTVSGDLILAFALIHSGSSAGTSPSWTAGLTNALTGQSASSWASNSTETFVGELLGAGTAGSYSPAASWTNSFTDRQQITLAFKPAAGGSTVNGTASVTGAGTVSAAAVVSATASTAGAGTVSAATVQQAGASVTGAGSVAATPTVGAGSAVTGAGTVTAAAAVRAGASVTGAGTVSAGAVISATASVTGAGSVTANAAGQVFGTASVTGVGTVAASPSIGSTSSVTGAGTVSAVAATRAAAAVTGLGAVAALVRIQAGATVTGAGQVTASTTTTIFGTASVVGVGIVTAVTGTRITPRPNAGATARPFTGVTARP